MPLGAAGLYLDWALTGKVVWVTLFVARQVSPPSTGHTLPFSFDAQARNCNPYTQSDVIRRYSIGILLYHEGSMLKIKRDSRELVSCPPLHCVRKQKEALSVNQEVGSHQT